MHTSACPTTCFFLTASQKSREADFLPDTTVLKEKVKTSAPDKTPLIIGAGNPWRGDDAIGREIASRLAEKTNDRTRIIELSGEGTELMQAWEGAGLVIVIDAVASGSAPGTIFRFDACTEKIPARFFSYSSHAFGLAEAIELARTLGRLPERLLVFGIEGSDFAHGAPVSAPVREAAEQVMAEICDLIYK